MNEPDYEIPREKLQQATRLMREGEIDTWLILSREGTDPAMPLLIGAAAVHPAAVFLDSDGTHTILTSHSDAAHFEETALFSDVVVYGADLADAFLAEFRRRAPRRMALNISEDDHLCDGLTRGMYMWIQEIVGARSLREIECSSRQILNRVRSIKSPAELDRISRAVALTCDIYDEVAERITCGMTEIEIADLFVDGMRRRDVVNGISHALTRPLVCLISAGLAHREPGDHRSRPGDMMVVDFSVEVGGYTSDIARTFCFLHPEETRPPEDVQRAFDTTVGAVHSVIESIRPGLRGFEVDAVGRTAIENGGYPTIRHSTGHQIGREVHDGGTVLGPRREPPRPAVEGVVEVGEVYAIEPTVIQDGGLPSSIVEENVVIEEHGARVLSRPQRTPYLVRCAGSAG